MSGYKKALKPAEIATVEDAAIDFGDIPALDDAFWREAELVEPDRANHPAREAFGARSLPRAGKGLPDAHQSRTGKPRPGTAWREVAATGTDIIRNARMLQDGDAIAEFRQLVVNAVDQADFGDSLALVDDGVGDCEEVGHNLSDLDFMSGIMPRLHRVRGRELR